VSPAVVALAVLLVAPLGSAASGGTSAAASPAVALNPFATGASASLAIGQTSLTTNSCGTTSAALDDPSDALFDSAGNLWVDDRSNNRILEFLPPFHTGMGASVVIGQSSFTTNTAATNQTNLSFPSGIAFDAAGNLWVADRFNNRVLEFVPPFSDGMNANLVLGQGSYTTATAATTASGLNSPEDLVFAPNGDLIVSDSDNERVLEFVPPFTNDMSATVVLGQASFTTNTVAATATGMDFPVGVAFGPTGILYVADSDNNRILGFYPPFTDGMAASLVIGQATFTTGTSATTSTGLFFPYEITVDAAGNLWVADSTNERVLEYLPPFTNGMAASVAIGQTGFITSGSGSGASNFFVPHSPAFDARGDLWAVDEDNCRVLEYTPPHFTVQFVESGLPSGTVWSVSVGPVSGASTSDNITLSLVNGSYSFTVGSVAGYLIAPKTSGVTVAASAATVYVTFSPAIAGVPPAEFALAVLAGVIVVALGVTFLLLRRRGGRFDRPGVQPAPPATPPTSGAPPPGAAQ
jgi:sugar lactone lactonase YvrE